MKTQKNRIWTCAKNKADNCWRELKSVVRNTFGDIVLTLDAGEIWQFTPHKPVDAFAVSRVKQAGYMHNRQTGEATPLACIILKEPQETIGGNLRILPRDAAPVEDEPAEQYAFMRNGKDFWEIVFEGRKLRPVRHIAGMTYLCKLLSKPGQAISALDLYETKNAPPGEEVAARQRRAEHYDPEEHGGTGGKAACAKYDPKIINALKKVIADHEKNIAELEAELADPDAGLSTKDKEQREDNIKQHQEKIEECRKHLAASKCATFEPKENKRARDRVAKAIDAALDAIQDEEARKHFRLSVKKGLVLFYAGSLPWRTGE